jgi:hypothetical protein
MKGSLASTIFKNYPEDKKNSGDNLSKKTSPAGGEVF